LGAVQYAGHTLSTTLKIVGQDPSSAPLLGLWSLTQMPHQGELFIPTYSKTQPKIYFGFEKTPPDELTSDDEFVRFKCARQASIRSECGPSPRLDALDTSTQQGTRLR